MLPAYVSGSSDLLWKYTDDPNDPECLTNWTYYDGQGNIIKNGENIERTLTWDISSDNVSRWCPLKRFMATGKENITWKYC
jgi:hypothetical protein